MDTPSNIRVGAFAREVQAAQLLRRVLTHIYKTTKDQDFNIQEALQLYRTLTVFAELLPKEAAATCASFCGAIGICNRSVHH
jgi:hypothetical protein